MTIKRRRPGQYPYDHRAATPKAKQLTPTPEAVKALKDMKETAGSGIVMEPRDGDPSGDDSECSSDSGS